MLSINSTEFSISQQPDGLKELTHRVYFSDELGGYLEEFSGDLTFTGADYNYLRRRFFLDGCAVVPVTLADSCGLSLNGNLFLNEAEWRPDICAMTVQVVDAGFLSLIDNNKGIKFFLNVPRSKNDVDISAYVQTQTDITFSLHDTNASPPQSNATDRQGVRLYDGLRMLVGAMTDGQMEFVSDFLNPAFADSDGIPTLLNGEEVRTGLNNNWPYCSFEDLMGDARKIYNLAFAPDVVNGVPALRVEPVSYFRQQQASLTFDPMELSQSAVREQYYALMKFGSKRTDPREYDNQYFPPATFYAWQEEEFHLLGQCNTSASLDLTMTILVTDTNRIQKALPTTAGGQDDDGIDTDVVMVTTTPANVTVVYINPTDDTQRFYNNSLTNFAIANRWGDGVPFPIFQFLGVGNNQAEGVSITEYAPAWSATSGGVAAFLKFPLATFPNGFDPSGNFTQGVETLQTLTFPTFIFNGDVTGYTAPVSAVFTIHADVTFAEEIGVALFVARFDSLNNFLELTFMQDQSEPVTIIPQTGTRVFGQVLVYANATDRLFLGAFSTGVSNVNIDTLTRSNFEIFDPFTFTQTYNPNDNLLIETSFEYPTAPETWRDFLNQRFGTFTVTHPNGRVRGFLKEANRNLHTGKTDWVLRSNFGDS